MCTRAVPASPLQHSRATAPRLPPSPEPALVMTCSSVRFAALALAAALATPSPAAAQYFWTGASSTSWNNPNNWDNGGSPGVPVSSATTTVTLDGTVRTVTTLDVPGGL